MIRRSIQAVGSGSQAVSNVTVSVSDVVVLAGQAAEQMEVMAKAVERQTGAIDRAKSAPCVCSSKRDFALCLHLLIPASNQMPRCKQRGILTLSPTLTQRSVPLLTVQPPAASISGAYSREQ